MKRVVLIGKRNFPKDNWVVYDSSHLNNEGVNCDKLDALLGKVVRVLMGSALLLIAISIFIHISRELGV